MFVANLCGRGTYKGKVVHGIPDKEYGENVILVLPDASEKYYTTMVYTARKNNGNLGIIVERGGQGAHLIVNANEKNIDTNNSISICLLPDATKLLKEGTEIVLSTVNHCIEFI